MLVEDVMTPHPVTTTAGATVQEALVLLHTYGVASLPVVDIAGRVRGVVTETDLVHHGLARPGSSGAPLVADVRTPHAVTVGRHADLAEAAALLTSHGLKSVPVVDRKGVVVGVLSASDVGHALAHVDDQVESTGAEALEPTP